MEKNVENNFDTDLDDDDDDDDKPAGIYWIYLKNYYYY